MDVLVGSRGLARARIDLLREARRAEADDGCKTLHFNVDTCNLTASSHFPPIHEKSSFDNPPAEYVTENHEKKYMCKRKIV